MSTPTTMQWIRQAGHRVHTGSGRLAAHLAGGAVRRSRAVWRRVTGWLAEGEGLGWLLRLAVLLGVAVILRKVVVAVAGGLYAAVADGRAPWLMWGAAGAWLGAAYRCGQDGWAPRPATAEPQPAPEQDDDQGQAELAAAPAPAPASPSVPSPVALIAAVRDIGTPHAQLVPLAQHLGTTTETVRAAAAALGWPVKDVRMKGRSSAAGLRWDEVPSPPEESPSPGVVGAGQPADDNDDDTAAQGPREGIDVRRTDGGLIIYDLADRHRRRGVVGL
ncbi:hypothetical protein ACH49_26050 [Streptomyces leeuwenhoekii]|uniref:Uncharacterized protein n=1 Tax=Streptomyces leeuwenhoekii TaxID=1437453 RepID=A0ABR5HSD6_STRLW|nr:hypothetical protein [Streptomyces leeuwenhoekii]KMS69802.1 hypothetical protein ACH49_26050 [Streptomyces leeuwenhoekii]